MKIYPKKFLKPLFIIFAALCFGLAAFLFTFSPRSVKADGGYNEFLPNKSEEYYALNSPIHAYSDDDITAVTNTNKQLILFKPNCDPEIVSSTTPLKQVMRFNSDYLLYSDNLTVTAIKLSDNSKTKLSYTDGNDEIKDLNNVFFDAALTQNGFIIATTNNQKLQLFYIDDALNVSLLPYFLPNGDISAGDIPASDAPVAVNSEKVFYVSGNQIHSKSINKLDSTEDYISVTPDYMIADDNNVYYIKDNKIYRLSISDKSVTLLNFADNDNYDLGKINSPMSLSFKNGNLLITDGSANGSVQEFKINNDTLELEFTGYAIASGLSAYNRVAANATNIERYGKYVAALDGNKLTVIDTENCADYNKDYFVNKYVGSAPNKFALGNDTILYSKGTVVSFAVIELNHIVKENNTAFYKNSDLTEELFELNEGETVKLLENKDGVSKVKATRGDGAVYGYVAEDSIKEIPIIKEKYTITGLPDGTPNDISYQSGRYYITYLDIGTNSKIVEIDESGKILSTTNFAGVAANVITADVFGNIFVADNDKVYKNEAANFYTLAGVKKLATDLAGNLFALAADGKIHKLAAGANNFSDDPFDVTGTLGTIKTFGIDFDRSEVYFLIDGKEQVYRTANAGNISLEDVTPNDGFINATVSKQELKVYSVKNEANANVYSVSQDGNAFKFNGLIEKAAEYPFIAEITVSNFKMCALASENGVVLINKSELEEKAAVPATAPEKAFLTTSVYAYAIPVIERNGTFAMVNESGKIKIDKGATVTVHGAFTLLDRTFYDATAKVNGEDLPCYIPADFTATVLAENFEFESYTVEKVKKTVLYKNDDLTEELFELEDGETVKLLERKDGVLKIAATSQEGTVVGYITANSLTSNPSVIVRNVLIILAVFGSLAGTISYFLLRKKR